MKRLHKIPDDMSIFEKIDLLKQLAKDGNIPEVLSGQDGLDILTYKFLGDDYYIADPVSNYQGNSIVVKDIIDRYEIIEKASFTRGLTTSGIIIIVTYFIIELIRYFS